MHALRHQSNIFIKQTGKYYRRRFNRCLFLVILIGKGPNLIQGRGGGGGGKVLTMTMTPWNLPHGQWSKKLTMTMTSSILPMVNGQKSCPWPWHPRFCPWSMVKLTNFDHLTTAILKFWPWSWSKIFDHLTMTSGRRPNGQKIFVILPPPPPNSKYILLSIIPIVWIMKDLAYIHLQKGLEVSCSNEGFNDDGKSKLLDIRYRSFEQPIKADSDFMIQIKTSSYSNFWRSWREKYELKFIIDFFDLIHQDRSSRGNIFPGLLAAWLMNNYHVAGWLKST